MPMTKISAIGNPIGMSVNTIKGNIQKIGSNKQKSKGWEDPFCKIFQQAEKHGS
jgi:hypothetical protein